MPEPLNIETRLVAIEGKIDALLVAEERRRKFAMWLLIISVAVIVLPLFAIPLMLPFLMSSLSSYTSTLSLPIGF